MNAVPKVFHVNHKYFGSNFRNLASVGKTAPHLEYLFRLPVRLFAEAQQIA